MSDFKYLGHSITYQDYKEHESKIRLFQNFVDGGKTLKKFKNWKEKTSI